MDALDTHNRCLFVLGGVWHVTMPAQVPVVNRGTQLTLHQSSHTAREVYFHYIRIDYMYMYMHFALLFDLY